MMQDSVRLASERAAIVELRASIRQAEMHVVKLEMLADRFARIGYPLEAERTRTLGDLTWKRLGQLRDHQRQLLHQG